MQYEIIRSKRKTISIQVYRDQRVLIRAPLKCKDNEISQFLHKHIDWIQRKLEDSLNNPGLPESEYNEGGALWLLGDKKTVNVVDSKKKAMVLSEDKLVIYQTVNFDSKRLHQLITGWKREFAATIFEDRLAFWSTKFPIKLPAYQFKIRKMKRQWGNCNHRGIITINSQLVRYPLSCIDYVIVHELTHLKYLNHGRYFYQLMASVMPDWKEQKQLLSDFSGESFPV